MKERSKKYLGAIIPALLLWSPAFASSARSISRVRSKNLAVKSETPDAESPLNKTVKIDDPFAVFGDTAGRAKVRNVASGTEVLDFLKNNNLLRANHETASRVSGELDSVLGRKDFAAAACSTSLGSIATWYTQSSCENSGGTWVTVAPTIESSSVSSVTSSGFTLNVDISAPGTVYAVVVARTGSVPTSAQVKAGQDGTGAAAVASDSVLLNTSGLINFTVANADQNLYNVYFVAEDGDGMTATPEVHNVLTETVYSKGTLNTYSSNTWSNVDIEIDDSNNIYTFYQSNTSNTFRISKWNGTSWDTYTDLAKSGSFFSMNAQGADMVVDHVGNIHVLSTASLDINFNSNDMYHNTYNGSWSGFTRVYDGSDGVDGNTKSPDFAFADSSNDIHLAFTVSDTLRYATNTSGSWATTSVSTGLTNNGDERWTVVGSTGTATVVYEEENSQDITSASSSDSFVSKTKLVDTAETIVAGNVIIDGSNKQHMVYSISTLGQAFYKNNVSGSWTQEQLTSSGFTDLRAVYIQLYGSVPYVLMYNATEKLFYFKRKVSGVWEDGKFFQATGANAFIIDSSTDKIFIPFQTELLHIYYYALPIADLFGTVTPNTPPTLGGSFTTNGTVDDDATIAPFSGVTVSDGESDNVSVAITYTAANGTLTGTGLTGSAGSYTVSSAAPATATSNLQGLVFHPTANQVAQGSTVVTTFTLTPNDGTENGTADSTTQVTATSVNDAPVNTVAPAISGTSTVGSQLTATSGTWTDADGETPTYSYQWYRADDSGGTNEAAISGATSTTYTLTLSDAHKYLRVVVTADDGHGSSDQTATSTRTSVTNTAPVNTVAPAISGTSTVGSQLSGTSGTWTDADGDTPTYSYQWYRADDSGGTNEAAIPGATSGSYTLSVSDAHKYLRMVVTANDGHGSSDQTATSTRTAVSNTAPVNTAVPAISGTSTVGNQLSGTSGTWTDADGDTPTYSYQWYRADDSGGTNEAAIPGATSGNYTLTVSDAHKYLRVVVTANDGHGSNNQTTTSTRTAVSNSAPVNTVVPAISGTTTVGSLLTTTSGTWTDADSDTLSYSYQWYRADDSGGTNETAISGATSTTYTLTLSDTHKYLRVVITVNDGHGSNDQTATSTRTAVSNTAPVNTVVPAISGTATVGSQLTTTSGTWTDADGDTPTYSYQWYRADDDSGTNEAAIPGATSSNYTLSVSDAHKYLRVVVTADDGNGSNDQTATSTWSAVTNSVPVNTVTPAISGTTTIGSLLTATSGTWTDADGDTPTYSYQWYRADDSGGTNEAAIPGATFGNYTLTVSDTHKYLRVVVTANDGNGSNDQTATSSRTATTNTAPVNIVVPNISGNNVVGGTLTASSGTWTDADGDTPTYAYQWKEDGNDISGEIVSTLLVTSTQAKKTITCSVTANDGYGGSTSITTSGVLVANSAPVFTGTPAIIGNAKVGNTLELTDTGTSDADGDSVTLSYQWAADGIDILGATLETYELTTNEEKKNMTCTLTADDGNSGVTQYTTQGVNESAFPWLLMMPALSSPNKVSM